MHRALMPQQMDRDHRPAEPAAHTNDAQRIFKRHYLPTTTIANVSGIIAPRAGRAPGCGGGGAANSAVINRMLPVLLSSVSVFARGGVFTFCSTAKLVGLFSL